MDRTNPYFRQVELLVQALPIVARQDCFALKGGSAINLFVRDLPRLSVDIDLVYLPREPRKTVLPEIARALDRLETDLKANMQGITVQTANQGQTDSRRLTVSSGDTRIKIELSPVLRGTVWEPGIQSVRPAVEASFGYAEIQVVSRNDLYAGKICAALDRQHPRDLFDVMLLLDEEGLDRDLFRTFLVYLISHRRPIAELLSPARKDISTTYEGEFQEMAREQITLNELLETREQLVGEIRRSFTDHDRQFLLSVKGRNPDWSLLGLPGVKDLPAVQWKMLNLDRMDADRHQAALGKLETVLKTSDW